MDNGMLSLRWENHRIAFLEAFASVRNKENYCDATIACDGKFFSVHKLILSTCSDYLGYMFERATKLSNNTHPVIVLQNVKYKTLECLLDYMYVGEVNVVQSELSTLIKAAECLKIKGLAVHDEYPRDLKQDSHNSTDKFSNVNKKTQNYKERIQEKTIETVTENISESRHTPDQQYARNTIPRHSDVEKDIHNTESNTSFISRKSPIMSPNLIENREIVNGNKIAKTEPIINETNTVNPQIKLEVEKETVTDEEYDARDYVEENFNSYDPAYIFEGNSFVNHMPQTFQNTSGNSVQRTAHASYSFDLFKYRNQDSPCHIDVNEVWNKSYKDESTGVACPICQKVYYLKGSFIYHYKTHTSERSFVCPHCSRCFIQKSTLDRHIKSHTGEKPFACRLCPRRFIQKSDLRNHILTHTGEKPFSCPNCMQAFARKTLLNYHMLNCQPIDQNVKQVMTGGETNLSNFPGSATESNEQSIALEIRDSEIQQHMETNNSSGVNILPYSLTKSEEKVLSKSEYIYN